MCPSVYHPYWKDAHRFLRRIPGLVGPRFVFLSGGFEKVHHSRHGEPGMHKYR